MVNYKAVLEKFDKKGEKSGWIYLFIPFDIAEKLYPNQKKAYRVRGKIDNVSFEGISLWPMGEGNFILPVNAAIRKAVKKNVGDTVQLEIEQDKTVPQLSPDFLECLQDDPAALEFFNTLPPSHQRYFSNWIESAKRDETKSKRILQALNALSVGTGFSEMVRMNKNNQI